MTKTELESLGRIVGKRNKTDDFKVLTLGKQNR